jgi:predicted glycogen debranching enzyme
MAAITPRAREMHSPPAMDIPLRRVDVARANAGGALEWLVANGLGGYASGTVSGPPSRRYHGLLVAALPAPLGRVVMLNHVRETLASRGGPDTDLADSGPHAPLTEFRLECGLPVWRYTVGAVVLEKTVCLPHLQNTVHCIYRVLAGDAVLRLRPYVGYRRLELPVNEPLAEPHALTVVEDRYELKDASECPPLRLTTSRPQAQFMLDRRRSAEVHFPLEAARGYPAVGALWSPGYYCVDLPAGSVYTLTATTEPWELALAHPPEERLAAERTRRVRLLERAPSRARHGIAAELVLAADQFVVIPAGRAEEAAGARAAGDEARTVIAGYHWFTDWGRDTMIGLEGLTLTTGRHEEAGYILRTFARYVREGLIPNLFPEGKRQGLYHTADATLWFFHAVARYLAATGDRATLRSVLPKLVDIVECHLRGTRFGIAVDARDGLLRQGEQGYQLTWMDAKVGDWVVTPRRGKAVEINALWYNALRHLERWLAEENDAPAAERLSRHAAQAYESFNRRFWLDREGYLFDVIDGEQGDDAACRPNQVFAIALDHPVLDPRHWHSVMAVLAARLLTPVGLRSLAPGHPDYKPRYDGDLRARDAAYHQGTVWAWLIGPYIDAWMKLHPEDRGGAHRLLQGFDAHLSAAGVGSVSEVFDAEPPYTARGCIAQAWSVAEVLRCLVKTAD